MLPDEIDERYVSGVPLTKVEELLYFAQAFGGTDNLIQIILDYQLEQAEAEVRRLRMIKERTCDAS